jgi:hypothetical protein
VGYEDGSGPGSRIGSEDVVLQVAGIELTDHGV